MEKELAALGLLKLGLQLHDVGAGLRYLALGRCSTRRGDGEHGDAGDVGL